MPALPAGSGGPVTRLPRKIIPRHDDRPQNDFYDIADRTRFGPNTVPGYRIVPSKEQSRRDRCVERAPGPGAYYPENHRPLGTRPPAFSLAARWGPPLYYNKEEFPAPNEYQKAPCLPPDCEEKKVGKSFGIRWPQKQETLTSGVPFYSLCNLNVTHRRAPEYRMVVPRMSTRREERPTPGPSSYFPQPPERVKRGFLFGIKYSPAVSTLTTDCEYEWA